MDYSERDTKLLAAQCWRGPQPIGLPHHGRGVGRSVTGGKVYVGNETARDADKHPENISHVVNCRTICYRESNPGWPTSGSMLVLAELWRR